MNKLEIVDIFRRRTRSPLRPRSGDVIRAIFPHFRQHAPYVGSLILGEADQWDKHLFVVAQQKPKPESFRTKEDLAKLTHGMLTAAEHSHVLRFLQHAAQSDDPAVLISFVDTYGADISMESARNFQAFFIAHLLKAYLLLPVPTISVVLGEGGSGGALAIQYADRRAQLDDALYATAPPESMAAIIFRDPTKIKEALAILKPTAAELQELGIIDQVIPSPKDVTDVNGFARAIAAYLEKSVKELGKVKISRLLEERQSRAVAFGLRKPKRLSLAELLKKTPLKKKDLLPPPDMKIITMEDAALQVRYDYGDDLTGKPPAEFVRCGDTSQKGEAEEGCGQLIPLNQYLDNHNVCPNCGRSRVMGALGWINCLTDSGSFHELYRDLTVKDLLHPMLLTPEYKDFVIKQTRRTPFKEALVTGEATIFGHEVVMAICEFYFSGGSMGVVFGEKFNRAVDYAIEKGLPLISLCCSGGARLYEGTLALMQMIKCIAAVERLKDYRLPFLSILADPSTGGVLASYAAMGDVIIGEPDALVIFTGPRVMKSRGFPVDEASVRAASLHDLSAEVFNRLDFFQDIRGIHEVAPRKELKRVLCKYLEFYKKSSGRPRV
ncbi:MAG: acetyl-CoA carboxylase carboxyl transferase subunit alpha/beta [Deltaproteobacteria bacterium]|nr:acetyl-CoA carboxylase carboxyl transferase subunit alpha/beta [Deltaproteobacteria bacterium]